MNYDKEDYRNVMSFTELSIMTHFNVYMTCVHERT